MQKCQPDAAKCSLYVNIICANRWSTRYQKNREDPLPSIDVSQNDDEHFPAHLDAGLCFAGSGRRRAQLRDCPPWRTRVAYSSFMSLRRARHRPDLAEVAGIQPLPSHHARCPGAWGEWRSDIKEEPEGRGTVAEPLTPSAGAYKSSSATVS